jgi:hypothetical protein
MAIAVNEPQSEAASKTGLRVQLVCAWSGVIYVPLFLFCFVVLSDFIPPPDPTASGEQIRAWFLDDLTTKRVGILAGMTLWALLVPWGVAVAAQTRRNERGFPTLTIIQIACATSTMALGVLMMMIWGVAAFRPAETSGDTLRMLNDFGWFIFLIDWAPVTIWVWAFGAAVILDHNPDPAFPRWVAYLSFWTGLLFFPAGLILFFKTGAFAFNGVGALYMPAGVFFLWYAVVAVMTVKSINAKLRTG